MAKAVKDFPRELYVILSTETGDEEYLIAADSAEEHAEMGERRKVAVYELKEILEVEGVPKITRKAAP